MDTLQKQNSNSAIQNFNNHKCIQFFEHVQFFIEDLFLNKMVVTTNIN